MPYFGEKNDVVVVVSIRDARTLHASSFCFLKQLTVYEAWQVT